MDDDEITNQDQSIEESAQTISLENQVELLQQQRQEDLQELSKLKEELTAAVQQLKYQEGQLDLLIRQASERQGAPIVISGSNLNLEEREDPELMIIEIERIALQRYALLSVLLINIGLYLLIKDYRIPLIVAGVSAPIIYFIRPLYDPLGRLGRVVARSAVFFSLLAFLLFLSSFHSIEYYSNRYIWVMMIVVSLAFTIWRETRVSAKSVPAS